MLRKAEETLAAMSPEKRDQLHRQMTGAAARDLIKRGDAEQAIREEVLASVNLPEETRNAVQRALFSAMRRVGDVKATFEA